MAKPLLGGDTDDSPNTSKSRLMHNTVEVLLFAILIFLIINLVIRTGFDTTTTATLSDSALTSIAFCILELLALLAARACIMTEGIIYVRIGFWIYIFSLLCFIIESSTFYNQNIMANTWYLYEVKQNNYQVVIEVLLRAGAFGAFIPCLANY